MTGTQLELVLCTAGPLDAGSTLAKLITELEVRLPTARIEYVDLLQDPEAATKYNILALPTLLKRAPEPTVRLIGEMDDFDRVFRVLETG